MPAAAPAAASASALEASVRAVFAFVLQQPSFPPGANFLERGGNSLLLAELQAALHARFGVDIPLRELLRQPTVEAVAARVRGASALCGTPGGKAGRLVLLRSGSMPPLFLVHGGSGVPPTSTPLLDALGEDITVMAFVARGFDLREPTLASIGEMADAYLEAMRRHQPHGPYALGAICAGSLVAIEMARRLRGESESVAPLLMFDPPLPPRLRPPAAYLWRRLALWALPLFDIRPVTALIGRRVEGRAQTAAELRVWLAFRRASFAYRPAPYDGAIVVVLDVLTPDGARAVQQAVRTLFAGERQGFPATGAENSPRPDVGFP